ncbi:mechanosensitive ion channel family protein [Ornithinimicrobium cerasi]|uniref:mechanosensitive ion channel family protein n=1 Tax=Ornithinimicrobium cerasi TaxID=2248773 RepID=UPI000EFF5C48|nr:hypothetical protein [Ornithinimicrobium cerasi]
MNNALDQLWTTLVVYVPKVVLFLLIIVVGWLVAKAIGKAVDKVLERVGFDRAVERGGVKKALAGSKYDASSIVGKLVYYTLLLFVLQMAFGVFGPNPISELLTRVIAFLPSVIVAIVIIVIAAAIAAAVKELISNTLGGLSYGNILANVAAVFVLGLGVIAALNQVGIATTVTLPVLITVLATVGGILVVGVGGGLIKPMQTRWERYLDTMATESENIKAEAAKAPSLKEQAQQAKAKVEAADAGTRTGHGASPADVPFDRDKH